MTRPLEFAFFGSSLVSSYWNGACTYYRGIIRALHELGHRVAFYEPIAYKRQEHRDIEDPDWARVVVYPADSEAQVRSVVAGAAGVDVAVKTSGVGVFDEVLEQAVLELSGTRTTTVFWDVDAPATLARMEADPQDSLRALVADYDLVLTYGGGEPVMSRYRAIGARDCVCIYNALDPSTHHPVVPDPRFEGDLGFLGNRLPDREARVDEFFFGAARMLPDRTFLLGGSGWDDHPRSPNVRYAGHVGTADHNAFNCAPRCVLNVSRDSMASNGWSPATRVFEAAGAGACLITDQWQGLDEFLEPGAEVLVASGAGDVAEALESLTPQRSRAIGEAARSRVLRSHTYAHRAVQVQDVLASRVGAR